MIEWLHPEQGLVQRSQDRKSRLFWAPGNLAGAGISLDRLFQQPRAVSLTAANAGANRNSIVFARLRLRPRSSASPVLRPCRRPGARARRCLFTVGSTACRTRCYPISVARWAVDARACP